MIKLFCLLLLVTTISFTQSTEKDYLLHMSGSYFVSSCSSAIVYNKTKNKNKALICGLVISLVIGVGKEIYDNKWDSNNTYSDLFSNTIGATLGIVTVKIAI